MTYEKLIKDGEVACYRVTHDDGKVQCIPNSSENSDYIRLMRDVDAGDVELTETVID